MDLVFLKLGGSLITDKSKPHTARYNVIKKISLDIKHILEKRPEFGLVIGTGGGSFPHVSAQKYKTKSGFNNSRGRYGYCVVENDAQTINKIFVEALLDAQIPAVSIQPSAMMTAKEGKLDQIFVDTIVEHINKGIIPVPFGDAIIDRKWGSTIFSTELVLSYLMGEIQKKKLFKIKMFINLGDTDGVLDENKKTISKITPTLYPSVKKYFYDNGLVDVTGGMLSKIEQLLDLTKKNIKSVVANGSRKHILDDIIYSESKFSTYVSKN